MMISLRVFGRTFGQVCGLSLLVGLLLLTGACRDAIPQASDVSAPVVTPPPTSFRDATLDAGLVYLQHSARAPGDCLFDNISQEPGERAGMLCDAERMTGGAAAGDFDGDGAIDLIVTRLDGHDLLFRNRGDGRFDEVSADSGLRGWNLASNGATWGDIDNDGDLDLFITTVGDTRHYLFINDGAGVFSEQALERGAAVDSGDRRIGFSATFGDYDLDGFLDLHITEWRPSQLVGEATAGVRLLRNRGADAPGYFEDVTEEAGVAMDGVVSQTQRDLTEGTFAFGSTFVDLDRDGWPDLAVASDFGTSRLFWNNGDGTFSDGTLDAYVGTAQNAMGTTFGDYDADGDLDWFVTSVFSLRTGSPGAAQQGSRNGNRLYRNDGGRRFTDVTDVAGVRNGSWGWGAAFFDADNDGDLDLTMTNGMEMMPGFDADAMRYWENVEARYTQQSAEVGLDDIEDGKGLLVFDADRDGDLDVFVVNNASAPRLYVNQGGSAGGWLRVSLEGTIGNRQGLGAQVTVIASGLAEQIREVGVSTHFLGQSEDALHFGLGRASQADLIIRWPVSGYATTLTDVPVNSWIRVIEGQGGYELVMSPR